MAKHATSRTLNPSGDYFVGGYFARTPHVQFLSLPSPPYEDLSHTVLAKQVFRVHTASRTKVTHSSEGHYGFRVLLFFFFHVWQIPSTLRPTGGCYARATPLALKGYFVRATWRSWPTRTWCLDLQLSNKKIIDAAHWAKFLNYLIPVCCLAEILNLVRAYSFRFCLTVFLVLLFPIVRRWAPGVPCPSFTADGHSIDLSAVAWSTTPSICRSKCCTEGEVAWPGYSLVICYPTGWIVICAGSLWSWSFLVSS